MTAGVNTNYYNQYQQYPQYNQNQAIYGQQAVYAQQTPYAQQTGVYGQNQVSFGHEPANTQAENTKQPVEDGKDDGKIGFSRATERALIGIGKFITGMFCDENGHPSLLQTAKTAAIIAGFGALCALTAGTAVPAILLTAGMAHTGLGAAKSAYDMYTADTDAEMIAASESFGSNMTGFALTLLGARALKGKSGTEMSKVKGTFKDAKGLTAKRQFLWNKTKAFGKETWQGTKETVIDAGKPFKASFEGVKDAYKNGSGTIDSAKDAATQFKENVTTQWREGKKTVSQNYKNIIDAKKSVSEDMEILDKQIEKLNNKNNKLTAEKSNATNDAKTAIDKKIEKNNAKIEKLEAEKQAMNEMNNVSTWEEGNKKVSETQTKLNKAKETLKNADKDGKAEAQANVDKLEAQLKAEKDVLARRTQEAQSLRDKIATKEKQLKTAQEAETPDSTKITNLQSELNALKGKAGADFLPDKYNIKNIQNKLAESKKALRNETNDATKEALKKNIERYEAAIKEHNVATSGGVKTNNINSFKRQILRDHLNVIRDINTKNSTPWITVGISGRNNQTNLEAEFYSLCDTDYKNYVKTLNKQQKEALLRKFQQEIA